MRQFKEIFSLSYSLLPRDLLNDFAVGIGDDCSLEELSEKLSAKIAEKTEELKLPPYLADLARLESAVYRIRTCERVQITDNIAELTINPELQLLKSGWSGLSAIIEGKGSFEDLKASLEGEFILVYRHPESRKLIVKKALESELLVLKFISEEMTPKMVAEAGQVSLDVIDQVVDEGVRSGVLLKPQSLIRRPPDLFVKGDDIDNDFLISNFFTLQWHITQKCDLHCRHCYDRSDRTPLSLRNGLRILDDLHSFCRAHFVRGQVSFSGGNPLLHPQFMELYKAAVDRDLQVAILGNPTDRTTLEKMAAIKAPAFYQVSLEGLAEHNDYMRGPGHFQRSLDFLDLLKELGIFSMVMLTLTRANLDQVLPLAEVLKERVDLFTFNRLAMVGEGAALYSVEPEKYRDFLLQYLAAAEKNPVISLKDNLFNIIKKETSQPLSGGCAGYGCGAAFNFLSLLPDGEVHACRKLPSLLGNIFTTTLQDIYYSDLAKRYRQGTSACRGCSIRPVCGGCPAVVHGFGLDVFKDKDPYCFLPSS